MFRIFIRKDSESARSYKPGSVVSASRGVSACNQRSMTWQLMENKMSNSCPLCVLGTAWLDWKETDLSFELVRRGKRGWISDCFWDLGYDLDTLFWLQRWCNSAFVLRAKKHSEKADCGNDKAENVWLDHLWPQIFAAFIPKNQEQ